MARLVKRWQSMSPSARAWVVVALLLVSCVAPEETGMSRRAIAVAPGAASLAESVLEAPAVVASGLPVTKGKYKSPRVVYAVPLADFAADETLLARGELSVSKCLGSDLKAGAGAAKGDLNSPCEGMAKVSPYDPEVSVQLVLAASEVQTAGVPLSGWRDATCSSKRHHCAISIAGALEAGAAASTGLAWVNLVAAASGGGANPASGDRVELEADCADGDYAACDPIASDDLSVSKGKLDVVRLGAGRSAAADPVFSERALIELTMPVRSAAYDKAHTLPDGTIDYRRTRVYEKEIAVQPGQIVDVRGEMHTHAASGLTARAYIGSTILLVADPVLHAQNPGVRTHPADQYVSGHNGFNCRAGQDCVSKKLGAVVVGPDAPPTMTVVYVAHAIYAREQDPAALVKIRPCQASWKTCGLEVVVRDAAAPGAAACGDGQCAGDEDDASCAADCGCAAVACAGVAPLGCYCDPTCSASGDCCADAATCQ